jgi:hydroxymethylpyrimidine/phosphomethylpyrimidine kinase
VTPNIPEAEVLSGVSIRSEHDLREAARRLFALGPVYVVITGGHTPQAWDRASAAMSDRIVDVVYDGDVFTQYAAERIAGRDTHGTGCAFSAAIAAHLALGQSLHEAIPLAQAYVAGAIRHAPRLGAGSGPINHFWRLDIDKAGRL